MKIEIKILENEYFWGGDAPSGVQMPIYAGCGFDCDFRYTATTQSMPMLLSSKGRYVWSERGIKITEKNGTLLLESDADIEITEAGSTLRDAYLGAMEAHFPFEATRKNGAMLPREFFKNPQFNTWVEFAYDQNQKGILEYAHSIVENGFTPGVLMIDEGWHTRYGQWKFDFHKFPDPKGMIDELHDFTKEFFSLFGIHRHMILVLGKISDVFLRGEAHGAEIALVTDIGKAVFQRKLCARLRSLLTEGAGRSDLGKIDRIKLLQRRGKIRARNGSHCVVGKAYEPSAAF